MKVIKKANVENWSYTHHCTNCDSDLEVEGSDLVYHYYSGDMREPSSESFVANCAVCRQAFGIPKEKIPRLLQIDAKERTERRSTSYWDR